MVIDPKGKVSKHYYAGSQRIVSRIAINDGSFYETGNRPASSSASVGGDEPVDEQALRAMQISDLTQILKKSDKGVPAFNKYVEANSDSSTGEFDEGESTIASGVINRGPSALQIYFYHPDHLGSSTFLTDGIGQVYQFYLNLPFG